jgi:bacterial/archaeal transporter family-2 protein
MNYIWMLIAAIVVGGFTSLQSAVNIRLGQFVGSVEAALISFIVGTIALGLLLIPYGTGGFKQIPQTPWYLLLGGLLGAAFVFGMVKIVPSIGAGTAVAGVIAGQLVVAIIIDHFGWFGLNTIRVDLYRIIGVVLLFAGVKFIVR